MIPKEKGKRSGQVTQLSTSRIPGGFTEKTARVNGVTLNYATGGTGPAVVLLHGYPQTWYMWRKVMPALAGQYTVIAPDLRGSGGSDAPAGGYDKASLAEDIHQLLLALGHAGAVSLVGHDIGHRVVCLRGCPQGLGTVPDCYRGAPDRREPLPVPVGDPGRSRLVELRLLHARQRAARAHSERARGHVDRGFRGLARGRQGRGGSRRGSGVRRAPAPARAPGGVVRLLPDLPWRRRGHDPPPRDAAGHAGAGDRRRGRSGPGHPRPDAAVRRRRHGRRVPLRSLGRGGKPGTAAQAPAAVPRLARRAREETSTPGGHHEHH